MGLFSFVGKALKGVAKVAGFIPGIGGTISKVAGTVGNLLDAKKSMGTTQAKLKQAVLLRGNPNPLRGKSTMTGGWLGASVLRSTPIMPGGAVSTPQGIMASGGGAPPVSFGGARSSSSGRKRKSSRKRSTPRKRRKAKLKFGSPAWRKKYMRKRR